MSAADHQPVLVEPLLRLLAPNPGDVVLDGTIGLGGHAAEILPRIRPGGRYVGIDWDPELLARARQRFADAPASELVLFAENYANFADCLRGAGIEAVDIALVDLGVNSAQLADAQRGFSFDQEGPLDMRYSPSETRQAVEIVNAWGENELADLFFELGGERASRKVAKRICQVRRQGRITTTRQLASAVATALAAEGGDRGKIHPATRVFQALRIAVNQELENARSFCEEIIGWLKPGGRLAVISFHSLEDAIAKKAIRDAKQRKELRELTKRPEVASDEERRSNPRSRSAKLRVAERV